MFTIDDTITDLKIADRNLFRVLFSMNNHQVANPETSLEEARSYVFFFREGGRVQAYVGLYFIGTDRRRYYSHSSNPFPEEALADVEDEARSFAEGLGAMLDELDFAKMSSEQRKRWIEDQEFLSGRKKEAKADAEALPAAAQPPAAAQDALPAEQPAQTAPPVQPAPVIQQQEPPLAPQSQTGQPPAPMARPQLLQQPAAPVSEQAGIARPAQAQPPRRTAPSAQVPARPPEPDQHETAATPEVVFEEAVKAGVVRAPMAQLKKDVRSATGMVSREKEALARLLASF